MDVSHGGPRPRVFGLRTAALPASRYLVGTGALYDPPEAPDYDEYMRERDPELGWPTRTFRSLHLDSSGSRPSPAFPSPQGQCISLYGDSFTWSADVEDADAWSNRLAQMKGCRVANFGVPGYGTDQMLLRFQGNSADTAPVVILGHFTGDIRRNVNRMRNLMAETKGNAILLKPRFVLKDGRLHLLPIFTPSRENWQDFVARPEAHLHSDHFLPGGPGGVARRGFPYTLSLLRTLRNERIVTQFSGTSDFYDPQHRSGALDLTVAILEEFVRLASERGKTAIVALIPAAGEIRTFRKTGRWPNGTLAERLRKARVPILDFGPIRETHLAGRDPCEITSESCQGHYNAEGYAVLAAGAARRLEMDSLSTMGGQPNLPDNFAPASPLRKPNIAATQSTPATNSARS